jgi:FkbM family methyltransferase
MYALLDGGFEHAICFEPSPSNAKVLRLNLYLNGLQDRVTVVEKAAGVTAGQAKLHLSRTNFGGHTLVERHDTTAILVEVTTVEAELSRLGVSASDVSLAWIDVEGYEGDVLAGWPTLRGRPTCMEYSPDISRLGLQELQGWCRWANCDRLDEFHAFETLATAKFSRQTDLLLV